MLYLMYKLISNAKNLKFIESIWWDIPHVILYNCVRLRIYYTKINGLRKALEIQVGNVIGIFGEVFKTFQAKQLKL